MGVAAKVSKKGRTFDVIIIDPPVFLQVRQRYSPRRKTSLD